MTKELRCNDCGVLALELSGQVESLSMACNVCGLSLDETDLSEKNDIEEVTFDNFA